MITFTFIFYSFWSSIQLLSRRLLAKLDNYRYLHRRIPTIDIFRYSTSSDTHDRSIPIHYIVGYPGSIYSDPLHRRIPRIDLYRYSTSSDTHDRSILILYIVRYPRPIYTDTLHRRIPRIDLF